MGKGLSGSHSTDPLEVLVPGGEKINGVVGAAAAAAAPPANIAILVISFVVVLLAALLPVTESLRPAGSLPSVGGQRQTCDTKQCQELFMLSRDYYQVQMEYERSRHPELGSEKWRGLCVSQRTFYRCLKAMYRNKSLDCHSNLGFRSAHNGIERRMEEMNCSLAGPVFDPGAVPDDRRQVCTYDGPPAIRYCALYGDPHLRTFADRLETCRIQGAWPLLDNRYLTVQVTSNAVSNLAGPATAITQLTVMIKRHDDCAVERFVTYQATAGHLPARFDDGSVQFGPEGSVRLAELSPNRHVEIYLRYIDTRVIVRHYPDGRAAFLGVALLVPETILNQSGVQMLELCADAGCPANQRVDYVRYLSRGGATVRRPAGGGTQQQQQQQRRLFADDKNSVDGMRVVMRRQVALARCRRFGLVDFYLDSCVFDLMNTGDDRFADAGRDAMADLIRNHPDGGAALRNRTALTLDRRHGGGGGADDVTSSAYRVPRTSLVLLLYAVLFCALTTTTTTITTTTIITTTITTTAAAVCQPVVAGLTFTLTALSLLQ